MLVPVGFHHLSQLRHEPGERYVISEFDHAIDFFGWANMWVCANMIIMMNRDKWLWPAALMFSLMIVMYGIYLFERRRTGRMTFVYSRIGIAANACYGMALLLAGGILTQV
jgi:hypothetical protein